MSCGFVWIKAPPPYLQDILSIFFVIGVTSNSHCGHLPTVRIVAAQAVKRPMEKAFKDIQIPDDWKPATLSQHQKNRCRSLGAGVQFKVSHTLRPHHSYMRGQESGATPLSPLKQTGWPTKCPHDTSESETIQPYKGPAQRKGLEALQGVGCWQDLEPRATMKIQNGLAKEAKGLEARTSPPRQQTPLQLRGVWSLIHESYGSPSLCWQGPTEPKEPILPTQNPGMGQRIDGNTPFVQCVSVVWWNWVCMHKDV